MVMPSASASARNNRSTCCAVWESRSPVGSSAKIRRGRIASARAIATRYRCPPDSWPGMLTLFARHASSMIASRNKC
ncbi:MAG: hypothetical protein CYG59_04835 [Chloroflexi bacterium]|nr:MAG: hypothetical protein CYG59_04835 [Chloroflexota bacterium]